MGDIYADGHYQPINVVPVWYPSGWTFQIWKGDDIVHESAPAYGNEYVASEAGEAYLRTHRV